MCTNGEDAAKLIPGHRVFIQDYCKRRLCTAADSMHLKWPEKQHNAFIKINKLEI